MRATGETKYIPPHTLCMFQAQASSLKHHGRPFFDAKALKTTPKQWLRTRKKYAHNPVRYVCGGGPKPVAACFFFFRKMKHSAVTPTAPKKIFFVFRCPGIVALLAHNSACLWRRRIRSGGRDASWTETNME